MNHKTTTKERSAISLEQFNEIWEELSKDVAAAFRMSEKEAEKLYDKKVAKLIASIPFLAGCSDAERTAVTHLGAYILSNRETKHYYNANTTDNESVFERIRLMDTYKGGNRNIIERGMSLIALTMIDDYKRDIHIDNAIGKYNPVADEAMEYQTLRKALVERIESIECPVMDQVYDGGGAGTEAYWGL